MFQQSQCHMCGKLCLRILTELEKEDNQKQTGSLADLSHNCSYRGFSCLGQTGETGGREEGIRCLEYSLVYLYTFWT